MKYISVCSGIEAATQAWHPLGWTPLAFSEIEPFPSAVLAHHHPSVPNLGDMTKYHDWPDYRPNLIVGGTPCQAFSIAGLRQGLSDPRGNLTLTFLGLVDRYRPQWVVWENVPGVLSDRTNAFGQFLAGLGQLGYGWAYRMLDAQYFNVAQRRKRVFVVANLGDWTRAAQVLFEPESVLGNPPPRREPWQKTAPTLAARTKGGGGLGTDFDCDGGCIPIQEPGKRTGRSTTDTGCGLGLGESGDPMFTLQAGVVHGVAHDTQEIADTLKSGGSGNVPSSRRENLVAEVSPCIKGNQGKNSDAAMEGASLIVERQWPVDVAPTLNASFGDKQGLEDQHALNGGGSLFPPPISLCLNAGGMGRSDYETETLIPTQQGGFFDDAIAFNHNTQAGQLPTENRDTSINDGLTCSQGGAVAHRMSVRRLTPVECERLQGFPDHFTQIPWKKKPSTNCPDGPRYKALGNSMAVPCMAWIGKRIAMVDAQATEVKT
jgi:DNA (cytosine-5)-methyltransferase 1